jgi:anti-sigma B factor antagonist
VSNSRMVIQEYAGVTVVTFSDRSILDAATIDQIGADLYTLVDAQHRQKLILDFCNVQFLSSHALGVLLQLHKKMQSIKGRMALCGVRSELMRVFQITNLDRVFKFFGDDAAALKSFDVHVK